MSKERIPAEIFPPGEIIRDELEARGWNQLDLAEIMGCQPSVVNELISAKRSIAADMAQKLGEAFGTDPQFWMNLEAAYQLHIARKQVTGVVAKRARLFETAPIREMVRRGWIDASDDPDVLEQNLVGFFGVDSLEEWPLLHAARKSTSYGEVTPAQWAWLSRARKLARCVHVGEYREENLRTILKQLRACLESPEEIRHVPVILSDGGIRFVIVEHLKGTKTDGACFWLDSKSPAIAMTLRYDRIDFFWFTLLHELGHIKNKDGLKLLQCPPDVDLIAATRKSSKRPVMEEMADEFAADFLVDQEELDGFAARVRPLFSQERIRLFAKRIGVHPGIVVGQLQYRGEIGYSHSRKLLVQMRQFVVPSVLTDGWGSMLPADL